MRRLLVLVAVLALVTAACKLETNFGAVINADGSGTIIAEVGVDDEAAELFLQGTDPFEGNELATLDGARTREERRGDINFYIIEVDVDDVTQIENQLVGNQNALLSDLTITVTDDRVTVTGAASAEDTLGGQAEGFDPQVLKDSISASVYFTMPGGILSHNADRQDGNTLYWEVPVLGGTLDIQAESDPNGTPASSGGGFPIWAYALLVVALLAAGWYFMKGRSGGASPAPAATSTTPATTFTAPTVAEVQQADTDNTPPPPPPAE
jgi:hypothetical protein